MKGSKILTDIKLAGDEDTIDKRITIALAAANGSRTIAAVILGISHRTMFRHIERRMKDTGA